MDLKAHWETIYRQTPPGEVGWYTPRLDASLKLLTHAGLHAASRVIDVGAGASTLVDDLVERGMRAITALDLSGEALAVAKARLGPRADAVEWMEADITRVSLPSESYDLWHDRAVFHFLTSAEDRRRYVMTMTSALKPSGQAVMATFSLHGPPRCSGLDVVRYSPEILQAELGKGFQLVEAVEEDHRTPFDTVQRFIYCRFQRVTPAA